MDDGPELDRLIDALGAPAAYDGEVEAVEVRQTHISVVFLVDDRVYKVKKPVQFEFLDYSTLERRRHFCEKEVELNRRLAPDVYRGVVPITEREGALAVGGDGEPVEWAVEMVRLPEEATLKSRLEGGDVSVEQIREVARRIAQFHDAAASGPEISEFADYASVSENALDNFRESDDQVGTTVHSAVFDRARRAMTDELEARRDLIEERAAAEVATDTHGDLRLDHVYLFPDDGSRQDIEIIDCIEFNDAFRYADPVADIAFLVMDLQAEGHRQLAEECAAAYLEAAGDERGEELMDLYVAYRAAVRGKVEGFKATEEEVPADERREARQSSAAHWMLALSRLEPPGRRPALVLVAGLPATGKSTLASGLARRGDFEVLDTDRVRKRLAGRTPDSDASAEPGRGIYTPEWSERTYGACRVRAEQALFAGDRVLVDATFSDGERRRRFFEMARAWGVPAVLLECTLPRETARERIEARESGPSDADWAVYEHIEEQWDPFDPELEPHVHAISTDGSVEEAIDQAATALEREGLL